MIWSLNTLLQIVPLHTISNLSILINYLLIFMNEFVIAGAKSTALPFLAKPAKLDGSLVGDFGFDPLGFTNTLNE